jgi:aquaporin Z
MPVVDFAPQPRRLREQLAGQALQRRRIVGQGGSGGREGIGVPWHAACGSKWASRKEVRVTRRGKGNQAARPKGRAVDLPGRLLRTMGAHAVRDEVRHLVAELFGAFALTFVAAGGEVIAAWSGGEVSPAARAVAPGLLVMALIYAIGEASGAHFNPAVTFAFCLRRSFPWRRAPGYWVAQFAGALLAGLLLRLLFGLQGEAGMTKPHGGAVTALGMEVLLTCFLVTVILGTATQYQVIGPNAALAVGGTIALCGLFAGPVSGASMNPARSLGPAVAAGALSDAWVYLAGPLTGAVLAVALTAVFHLRRKPGEVKAATGDGKA